MSGLFHSCNNQHAPDASNEYSLVWSDEFDYIGYPDSTKWAYDIGNGCPHLCGWGNNELQYYTRKRLKNARVSDGLLIIEVHQENIEKMKYSSAKLVTKGIQDWRYGRFEIRARLPLSNGIWSAIWMLPSDTSVYGGWPNSGEIDIMENVGYDQDSIVASVHTGAYNFNSGTQLISKIAAPDNSSDFNTYTLDWTEDSIRISINDNEYFTIVNSGSGADEWPFDQPMYLILNVAYGGNWGGINGLAPDQLPQKMEIDYVRVYQ